MSEKTYSTFYISNLLMQQQYRERKFKKYSELISYLLIAEQNNKLLIKNHNLRPNESTPFPEVNKIVFSEVNATLSHKYGRGRGRARGHGKFRGGGHNRYAPNVLYKNTPRHQR